jgi:hypothetical protein
MIVFMLWLRATKQCAYVGGMLSLTPHRLSVRFWPVVDVFSAGDTMQLPTRLSIALSGA